MIPIFTGYSRVQLNNKYFGGSVIFKNPGNAKARYISTMNLNMSVWVSDMKRATSPLVITLRTTYNGRIIWQASADGRNVNGFTLPRKVFDLGSYSDISDIVLTVDGDNYEILMWSSTPNQQILLYS
jgi:hypothetical protein